MPTVDQKLGGRGVAGGLLAWMAAVNGVVMILSKWAKLNSLPEDGAERGGREVSRTSGWKET